MYFLHFLIEYIILETTVAYYKMLVGFFPPAITLGSLLVTQICDS